MLEFVVNLNEQDSQIVRGVDREKLICDGPTTYRKHFWELCLRMGKHTVVAQFPYKA